MTTFGGNDEAFGGRNGVDDKDGFGRDNGAFGTMKLLYWLSMEGISGHGESRLRGFERKRSHSVPFRYCEYDPNSNAVSDSQFSRLNGIPMTLRFRMF